jgi:hypothetical protein
MLQLGARIVAHKLEFEHPDYSKIHLSAAAAGYMRDSIVDGLGKRHTYPGLYRNLLPLVIPKPLGGSVVTMTLPVGLGSTSVQVAVVLEQELETPIRIV